MIGRRLGVLLACVLLSLSGLAVLGGAPAFAALKATYLRELTGEATPAGRLEEPHVGELAVDDVSGDVLVADNENHGIDVFDSLGNYVETWTGSSTPAKAFGSNLSLATDNSTGDVYVADPENHVVIVLDSIGDYVATWDGTNTPSQSFNSLDDVSVDPANGHVYVSDRGNDLVDIFERDGTYLSEISGTQTPFGSFGSIARLSSVVDDASGEVLIDGSDPVSGQPLIYVFNSAGSYLTTWEGLNTPEKDFGTGSLSLAVDESTGDIIASRETASYSYNKLEEFDSSGNLLTPEITGSETPVSAEASPGGFGAILTGVAFDQASSDVYVPNARHIDVFSTVVVPDVLPGEPSAHAGEATLNGLVDPDGVGVSECRFEYGSSTAYGESIPCAQSASTIGGGKNQVSVSAAVTGLSPDSLYHYRLVAANANGSNASRDGTFFTSTPPVIEAESTSSVESEEAIVTANVDPEGLPSAYRVEYGTTTAYGSTSDEIEAGDATAASPVRVRLSGLVPGSQYHFRFVATNSVDTALGADAVFTTSASVGAASAALPDNRAFELVSPPRNAEDWGVYGPVYCSSTRSSKELSKFTPGSEFLCSERPVQAASDGQAIAFLGDPTPGGGGASGNGYGNQFVSSRIAPGSWSVENVTPVHSGQFSGVYRGFSNDLSVGVLGSFGNEPATAEASSSCTTLYTHGQAGFKAMFDGPFVSGESCFGAEFAGVSSDGSIVAFEMPSALTANAPAGGQNDLYESDEGRLSLVNVLPNGTPVGGARFGSANGLLLSHDVSADGSRLFWTDLSDDDLYAREDGGTPQARTVLVAEEAEFETASSDGSLVFYLKGGDLYMSAVGSGQTSDIASGGEVRGVIGASEDGSYVYYVAAAALNGPGGELLRDGDESSPVAGEDNLYVYHAGATSFIATLDRVDYPDWQASSQWGTVLAETEVSPVYRTAEVASSGLGLVFMSDRSLTGYDSTPASGSCGETPEFESLPSCDEVFVYNAGSGVLSCASCSPTGRPVADYGGQLSLPTGRVRLPRWISEDGSEVFFDSAEALVPQATSGKTQVYEWEREGSGSCKQTGGCVYLLSAGSNGKEAVFLDASASGGDVFFLTRAQLVPQEQGDDALVYDARVDGYRAVSPPACTGTGCQGTPGAPPIFATPSSVTFNGVGNFSPPTASHSTTKVKSKKAKTCRPGRVRKKGKCVKRKIKTKSKAKLRSSRKASKRAKRGRK